MWRWLLLLFGILLVLLAVFTLSARFGLPLVAGYKSNIEDRLSDYLKSPVTIGELSLSWQRAGPVLKATHVSVIESVERHVAVDELLLDINLARSLMRGVPVINELTMVGADLAVEYAGDGSFRIHGVEQGASREKAAGDEGLDGMAWLTNAGRVGLLDTTVTLIDKTSGQQLVIEQLNVRAENTNDTHQLRIDLQLPPSLGGRLDIGIDMLGTTRQIARSSGNVYVKADALDIQQWNALHLLRANKQSDDVRAKVFAGVLARLKGGLDFELWGKWQDGQLHSARGDVAVSALVDQSTDSVIVDQLSAELVYRDNDPGWSLQADNVILEQGDDRSVIEMLEVRRAALSDHKWLLRGYGKRMPVTLAARLPMTALDVISPASGEWLRDAQPGGELNDWQVEMRIDDGVPDFSGSASIDNLSWLAASGKPGVQAISGEFQLEHNRGSLKMTGRDIALDWPLHLQGPVSVDALDATFDLDFSQPQSAVLNGKLELADAGVQLTNRIRAAMAAGQSPLLDIQGRFAVADVSVIPAMLPLRKKLPSTARWFDHALQGGRAENGQLLLFGRLSEFPFADGQGVFRAGFDLSDGTLGFLPSWPTATELAGRVEINGSSLTARASSGRMLDYALSRAIARIPDLTKPELDITTTAAGKLQSLIDFANTGPLEEILQPVLGYSSGTGKATVDLSLNVPLYRKRSAKAVKDAAQTGNVGDTKKPRLPLTLTGSVFLRDNKLSFRRANLVLTDVSGAIGFHENGVRISNLRGQVLGQPVGIDAQTIGVGAAATTTVTLAGALDARVMLEHYEIPLQRFTGGPSHWQVSLIAPHSAAVIERDGVQLKASSDLVGTQINLPTPLYKSSGRSAQFTLQTAFRNARNLTNWHIHYAAGDNGDELAAVVKIGEDGMEALSARLGGGEPNVLIEEGIRIEGQASELALDGWVKSVSSLLEDLPPSDTPTPILPVSANLVVNSLVAGRQSIGSARFRVNTDDKFLNAVIENRSLRGNIRYPRAHWKKDIPAKIRIAHLDKELIDALQSGPDAEEADKPLDPRQLPPIEARVSSLTWDSLKLHDVIFGTRPVASGLSIDTLGFAYRSMQLVGTGEWHLLDPQAINPSLVNKQKTRLDLTLQSDDFGDGLSEAGFPGAIAEGRGMVEASLSWPGPLYRPSLDRMGGDMTLALERGRIVPLEPGAARLVGLFALQAIPRRLDLDFRDVVSDGLAFQKITGDVELRDGVANTSLIQLTGPIGVVDITGESNLLTHDYNQTITVLPRISAALPIIGMITGGASAGIGALVAGGFLKAVGLDLDRIGLRKYELTGSWDAPLLDSVPLKMRRQDSPGVGPR
ncbi:MAG: DUF3971 domain-containing protein [Granulosicoccus sp.]